MSDPVKNPSHYQFAKPCLDVRDVIRDRVKKLIEVYGEGAADFAYDYENSIKYLLRAPFKYKSIEDLNKAKYCIDTLLSLLTSEQFATNQSMECGSDIPTTVYDEILGIDVPADPDMNFVDYYKAKNLPRAKLKGQGW